MPHDVSIDSRTLPAWPPSNHAIKDSIQAVFDSGDWGRYTAQANELLATQLADLFAVEHVRLCASGTAGIELALQAVHVRQGSEVIIAGYDYPGNIRAVESAGALPVIVDTLPNRWVINPDAVQQAISSSTSAILASHLYGDLFDAPRLRTLADDCGVALIEDACQSHGAMLAGRPVGSWGHVGVLSFGGPKLMTSGSGGAVLMSDDRIAQRATVAAERPSVVAPLSPLQAAALLPQIETLPGLNMRRRASQRLLKQHLKTSRIWQFADEPRRESETTFFKTAWFLPNFTERDVVIGCAKQFGLPLGQGFVGFLRRAKRMYRSIGDLSGSQRCNDRCVVMDHRVLLGEPTLIRRVAETMLAVENQVFDGNDNFENTADE